MFERLCCVCVRAGSFFQDFGQGVKVVYKAYGRLEDPGMDSIVRSTISMHSMLMLGLRVWGMPPRISDYKHHYDIQAVAT